MNLLFFENCISPHQVPYIKELTKFPSIEKVSLIVPRYNYKERVNMGWNNTNLLDNSGINFVYKPNKIQVQRLLCENNVLCFFSGIRADKDVFEWFQISLKYEVKRYIITEPPFTFNKPLWMHYIRFYLQDYKFVNKINGIFGIGEAAVKYYNTISKKWKVFPFQYVTEHRNRTKNSPTGNLKLIFVGNLCKRKNVKLVLKALKGLNNIDFAVIGDGEERLNLETLAKTNKSKVSFLGSKGINEIPSIMQEYDILVLPSLHDGWGAVVNEAMDLGLYVIVSNKCGAKIMIEENCTGNIFLSDNVNSLRNKLLYCLDNKEKIRNNLNNRIASFQKYEAKSVSQYFIDKISQ